MLVATVTLGVASEASKKELAEWGDRQIRGNENEGDGARLPRVGNQPSRGNGTELLEFLGTRAA
jgi:hypothetical protein